MQVVLDLARLRILDSAAFLRVRSLDFAACCSLLDCAACIGLRSGGIAACNLSCWTSQLCLRSSDIALALDLAIVMFLRCLNFAAVTGSCLTCSLDVVAWLGSCLDFGAWELGPCSLGLSSHAYRLRSLDFAADIGPCSASQLEPCSLY